jgi:hypothetical protein
VTTNGALPNGPIDWTTPRSATRLRGWTNLRDWVARTCHRYALDHRTVPPCWYLHPALVDVLSALHEMHRWCYDPSAPLNRASEFHMRLRDLEPRLIELTARTGCTRDAHRPIAPYEPPTDGDRFATHVRADVGPKASTEIHLAAKDRSHDR